MSASYCTGRSKGWACTEPPFHLGDHVAQSRVDGPVLARWGQGDEPLTHAAATVIAAAMDWADMWGDATAPVSTPEHALVDAVRDYRAVVAR